MKNTIVTIYIYIIQIHLQVQGLQQVKGHMLRLQQSALEIWVTASLGILILGIVEGIKEPHL